MFKPPPRPAGAVYLRVSLTERCDLRCAYCRPASGGRAETPRPRCEISAEDVAALVDAMHEAVPLHKVRLTGGEPLVRRDVPEVVKGLRRALPEATLALTTNGQRLAGLASSLVSAGLDALNVSLDTLDPDAFQRLTPLGRLGATLEGLGAARDAGVKRLKTNTVLMRDANGHDLPALVRFAASLGAEARFIELMPIGTGAALFKSEYLSIDEARSRLAAAFEDAGPLPASGTAQRHRFVVDGREVGVGFIAPVSHPFCATCDRLRVDAAGRLGACLRESAGVDLLAHLRAGRTGAIRDAVRGALREKTCQPDRWPERPMLSIGG